MSSQVMQHRRRVRIERERVKRRPFIFRNQFDRAIPKIFILDDMKQFWFVDNDKGIAVFIRADIVAVFLRR